MEGRMELEVLIWKEERKVGCGKKARPKEKRTDGRENNGLMGSIAKLYSAKGRTRCWEGKGKKRKEKR
jgi:hypothetical protein